MLSTGKFTLSLIYVIRLIIYQMLCGADVLNLSTVLIDYVYIGVYSKLQCKCAN